MRVVVSLGFAALLGACAGTTQPAAGVSSAGAWRVEQRHDPVNGLSATAMVGKSLLDPRTLVSHQTLLQLMCFDGVPIVRFAFDFDIGFANSTTLSYRFDDKPGHPNVKMKLAGRGAKVVFIEDPAAVKQLVDELATATVLHLQIASLTRGRTNIDFPVAGAPAAIEASYAACPIAGGKLHAPKTAAR